MEVLTLPPARDEEAQRRIVFTKGYLPTDVTPSNSNVSVYVNRFPLGDIDNFKLIRFAYALSRKQNGDVGALKRYAPWETAYYQALEATEIDLDPHYGIKAQGDYVSGIDGGYLAPEAWSQQWSDLLRPFSAIGQLPVTKLSVPFRVVHLPKVTADITVGYPGENTAPSATQFSFGLLTYTARKADAVIAVSNELIRDAPGLAERVLQMSSAGAVALDRDTQILLGQGGPGPTGLIYSPLVQKYYPGASASAAITTTPGHATPSFNHLSQLRGKVHNLNGTSLVPVGQAHCNGMIVHSRFEQTVLTLGTAAGPWTDAQGRPLWQTDLGTEDGASSLLGQKWILTNILPTNSTDGGGTASSYVIAGWWEQFALFEAQQILFETTQEASYFANDQTGVRIKHRWDAAPIHAEAFAVMAGVDQ